MKRLYVGNLAFQTSEDDLNALFAAYGEVQSVSIITDRETGRSRGFGFVEMSDDDDAQKAIDGVNGQDVGGRVLNVNEARPRPQNRGPRRW